MTIGADDRVVEYFGGIGRNVACNLATLGAPVTLAGAISAPKDAFATDLVRRGVTPLPLAEATVGRITTRLGPDGRRRLIDRHLPAPDTFAAPLPDAVCDIATDACCVLVETGLDLTGIEQLCGVARDCHAVTVGLVTRAFDREAHASLRPGVFDWVLLNQHELCLVTGEPGVEAAARSLAAALGANLAVTLAEQGALIVDHQECLRLPAPPAEVVDEL
ncbi:MAG: pfkB family carbohydrate kinase, partial [Actinomycetota bacterium]